MNDPKTLIFADLHLGTASIHDADAIVSWTRRVIQKHKPQRVVFDGDTFELILPMEHDLSIGVEPSIHRIISAWQALFYYHRESDLSEIIFLRGEHDAEVAVLDDTIQRYFPHQKIITGESWHDATSNSLVVHGHQFDYNRIFWDGNVKISCIDGLTFAINKFLSQTSKIEQQIRNAVAVGKFSYWYAYGELPRFISAVERLFGADSDIYLRECARVLRDGDLDRWLAEQSSVLTHVCGRMAKIAALHPRLLLQLYDTFYRLLDLHVKWKMRNVLIGRPYKDQPEDLNVSGGVRNLITGHFHEPRAWHWEGRSVYNIGCPKLSVAGTVGDELHVFRDLDF